MPVWVKASERLPDTNSTVYAVRKIGDLSEERGIMIYTKDKEIGDLWVGSSHAWNDSDENFIKWLDEDESVDGETACEFAEWLQNGNWKIVGFSYLTGYNMWIEFEDGENRNVRELFEKFKKENS